MQTLTLFSILFPFPFCRLCLSSTPHCRYQNLPYISAPSDLPRPTMQLSRTSGIVNSRKLKRKQARVSSKQAKHQSWVENQKRQRLQRKPWKIDNMNPREISLRESDIEGDDILNKEEEEVAHDEIRLDEIETKPSKKKKKEKEKGKRKRTKFEEYLEMDMTKGKVSAQEDFEIEKRLAKKLKVKNGKLRDGSNDEFNLLFGDMPSVFDLNEQKYQQLGDEIDDDKLMEKTNAKKDSEKKKIKKAKQETEGVQTNSPGDSFDGDSDPSEPLKEVDQMARSKNKIKKEKQKVKKEKQKVKGSEIDSPGDNFDDNSDPSQPVKGVEGNAGSESQHVEPQSRVKYVAPHMRSCSSNDSKEHTQIRRRIRGLLNRLSEANVESITGEISTFFQSTSRSIASQIIIEEILASCIGGPRGNERYAAAFAAFVAALACMVGIDFGAKLLVSLAKSFEDEYHKEDNLSLRNITLLLCYLYIFGVVSSDLMYDFVMMLANRMTEVDVSTILAVLQCCGMKLRSEDPAAMKDFIIHIQKRVSDLKALSGDNIADANGKRMEFMLETICDIKNNKRKKEDIPQHTPVKKWLQKLRVDDATLHGIKWKKLLNPNKKGQWWLSGDMASAENVEVVASTIDKDVLEAQKMLQLATAQRMNTDTRKAIFLVIMGGDDYIDAFEKLLRLKLQGKQDRDIMRVLLICCLQEKVFNKYYVALAAKLCAHDKNHKFTLQYCIWDQYKELESMPLLKSMHLAKFVAEMLSSFALSLAVLKFVDFNDVAQLTPKRIIHFRMLFEAIYDLPDNVIWNVFTRVAVVRELEIMRNGIVYFTREHVLKNNKSISDKFKLARKAFSNAEGVLM